MFSMNRRGYDALTSSLLTGQQDSLQLANQLNLNAYLSVAVAASEAIRIALKESTIENPNASFYEPMLFALAKSCHCSVYVGLWDGFFVGYGPNNATFYSGVTLVNNTGGVFTCDEVGHRLELHRTVSNFNVLARPWYKQAASTWGAVRMADVYSFSAGNSVGTTFSAAIAANLSAPSFSYMLQGRAPLINRTGLTDIFAVVGVDVELKVVASFLSSIRGAIQPESVTSWIFDNRGFIVATSDPTIALQTPSGDLKFAIEVDSPVIVESMRILLQQHGQSDIPPPTQAYASIPDLIGMNALITGQEFLLSHTSFIPADDVDVIWHIVLAQPRALYYQPITNANTVALILIFLLLLPTVLILSGWLAQRLLSQPIHQISRKMNDLTTDFKFGEPHASYSCIAEVQTIQRSFDSMHNAIKSFSKFAPVHVVKSLLFNRNEAILGVEDTECTIFFSDIIGFTQISESVLPEVLISTLAEYFNSMAKVIEKYNGLFLDFQGDSVFARFAGPDHEIRAVEAAVEQQEILNVLRRSWKQHNQPELFVRMGINSGRVLAGNIGSVTHMKYTCIGDNVNLAARLEGLSRMYGVSMVLSQTTYNAKKVHDQFVGKCLDYVTVFGKLKPTLIVTIIGRRNEATEKELLVEQLSFRAMQEFRNGNFVDCLATRKQLLECAREEETEMDREMINLVQSMAIGIAPEGWTGARCLHEK
jgi:class 3 adenylate cyclase